MAVQSSMFDDEPRPDLSQWYTPPKLARMIVEWALKPYITSDPKQLGIIPDVLQILEPSAGRGALIKDIPTQHFVIAFDIDLINARYLEERYPDNRVFCANFLTFMCPGHFDLAIMNPPYENDQDLYFARRVVVDGIADRAVMLMRSVFRHGRKRWEEFWRFVDLKRQVDLVTRPKFGGNSVALSDFSVFDVTKRSIPLDLCEVQQVEVERWIV